MARKELKEEAERLELIEKDLKREYAAIKNSPAIADLLAVITVSHNEAHAVAVAETENAAKAMAALQHANAYDKIRLYITEMMS